MARIEYLSDLELKKFEKVPEFENDVERNYYFTLPCSIHKQALTFGNDQLFIFFTLIFGYFKATNMFFEFDSFSLADTKFISDKYQLSAFDSKTIFASRTTQRYKQLIKAYLGVNEYSNDIELKLQNHAIELANNFTHRKKIFFSLVDYSKKLNIEIPSQFTLSKLIGTALTFQTKHILLLLRTYQKDKRLKILDEFVNKDENFKNRYYLSNYRKLGHSTNKREMNSSLFYLKNMKSKFHILKPIIDEIGITSKISQYYARWLEQSKITQLTQKDLLNNYFLLLSFVKYQYFIRNDNIIDRFISIIQSAKSSILRHQKDLYFENEPNKKALIKSLENSNLSIINNINNILNNETFNDATKIKAMHSLVEIERRNLKNILEQKSIIEAENLDRFDFIETISLSLQGKLSEIVKHIEFDEKSSNKNLIQAINYFKNNTNINKNAPIDFLEEDEQEAIFDGDRIKISLYKALLFIHISDGIKSGILNLKYSYKYKSFESYLIPKEEYKEQKDDLLKQYEIEHLKEFSDFLLPISEKLELNFSMTNRKIENELNIHFKITNNSFSLTTPKLEKSEEQIEHTISKYFPQSEFISVIDLLHSVQIKTDFLESFKHYSIQNVRTQKLDSNLLFASIVGYGCNISLSKMAKISKGISENQLDNATTWYLSEENTIESNDKIVAFIDSLELPRILKNDSNINHTSSDGQKFNIKSSINSTNAGFSFKYFGTAKGVSVYTFIDESHKLFYSTVINVSERESGYVIDGLMHNDVIKSDIHSTDTAGFTDHVFALMHLLGFRFAPRIRDLADTKIYIPQTDIEYEGLKPMIGGTIKIKHIQLHWNEIIRLATSIKQGTVTASLMLRKLGSYPRQNGLALALRELGRIERSLFILDWLQNVDLRRRVNAGLNKGEARNALARAVFLNRLGELRDRSFDQQRYKASGLTLVTSAIVLWNTVYLERAVNTLKEQGVDIDESLLQYLSPLGWEHINLTGDYIWKKSFELKEGKFRPLRLKNFS